MGRIEEILLQSSQRGMDRLARHLPGDYCMEAARAAWKARRRVLVTTGFYILSAGRLETDGPPGAFFLARGLALAGSVTGFVAEGGVLTLLSGLADELWPPNLQGPDLLQFPIVEAGASDRWAAGIATNWKPSLAIAIERCGRTEDNRYLNSGQKDITPFTAQVDALFAAPGVTTIGIGDGGNEVGMGKLAKVVRDEVGLPSASITPADHLVAATVSNWGAYGLLACLGAISGRDLLPSRAELLRCLELTAEMGAVNSATGLPEPLVDGFPTEVELDVLDALREAISVAREPLG